MRSISWKNVEYKVVGFIKHGKEKNCSKVEYNETPPRSDLFYIFKTLFAKICVPYL
jgi:hypothetical protein